MKILHILPSFGAGGAEVYVRDISIQMQRLGHEVCIAYISSACSTGHSEEFEKEFKSILDHAGVQYSEIGHDCRRKFWLGVYRLRQIIRQFKPDVIHSHLYYGLVFLALSNTKIPIVYTHHVQHVKNKYLFYFFNKFIAQYIGISKDCSKSLETVSNRNIVTIYNGVNYNRIVVKDSPKRDSNELCVISVGRLHEQKNYSLMIDSIRLFFNNYQIQKKILFKIVGEGQELEKIQQKIKDAGLQEKVLLLGICKNVSQLLHDADIFLMSSDYEGLPIALLEALMTGLPAIVTDVGGCRDVVETCNAGIVVPPKNAASIAEALNLMISNSLKRAEWSNNAKLNARKFDISISVKEHLNVYHSLILYHR